MIVNSDYFKWDRGVGRGYLPDFGHSQFPQKFEVRSAKTGRVVSFHIDHETMEQNEFFDGEMAAYISDTGVRITLTH